MAPRTSHDSTDDEKASDERTLHAQDEIRVSSEEKIQNITLAPAEDDEYPDGGLRAWLVVFGVSSSLTN